MIANKFKLFNAIQSTGFNIVLSRDMSFRASLAMKILEQQHEKKLKKVSSLPAPETKTIIHAVATGVPEFSLTQREYIDALMEKEPVLSFVDKEKLTSLFMNTCINKRHFSKCFNPVGNLSSEEKTAMYVQEGTQLAVLTIRKALEKASMSIEDIGKIVLVSSTDMRSPGLDANIINELGLPRNISRTNISFTGCGGGLSGLSLLNDYSLAKPGGNKFSLFFFLPDFNQFHM